MGLAQDKMPVFAPYPTLSVLDRKRLTAQMQDTSYVYDFPGIFALAAHLKVTNQLSPGLPPLELSPLPL